MIGSTLAPTHGRWRPSQWLPSQLLLLGAVRSRLSPRVPRSLYWPLARQYAAHCTEQVDGYATPVRPYALLWVDPSTITRPTGRAYPPWENRFEQCGTVVPGEWDRRPAEVDPGEYPSARLYHAPKTKDSVLYRSMKAHFADGVPWRDTELVAVATDIIADGHRVWHDCDSREDVLARCARLDQLWERLSTEEFRSQLDLAAAGETSHRVFDDAVRNEVAVDVGRDGELFLVDGKHRHAMATLQGVDEIPVVVYARHPEWMNRRDAVASGEADGSDSRVGGFGGRADADHPDLRDLPATR